MHIGIDFDNTIVSYDALFHRVALETRLIPQSLPPNKAAVRNHLRNKGLEDTWTEMQGYVYGARMNEAAVYPGFSEFVLWARSAGHTTSIVSHRTRLPFAGPPYDLHGAARAWINTHLLHDGRPLFAEDCIFFELTKQQKLARIKTIACDAFIDDLPEMLLADGMPRIRKLLFDPDANHAPPGHHDLLPVTSWADVHDVLDA